MLPAVVTWLAALVAIAAPARPAELAAGFPEDYEARLRSIERAASEGLGDQYVRRVLWLAEAFAGLAARARGDANVAAIAGAEACLHLAGAQFAEGVYPAGVFRKELERLYERAPAGPFRQRVYGCYGRSLAAGGHDRAAAAIFERLGVIRDWYLIGPFDNERGVGFAQRFGPEAALLAQPPAPSDLAAEYQGKKAPVRWRKIRADAYDGAIDLDELLRPNDWSACYLLTWFRLARAGEYVLSVGSDDGVRVWLDGAEIVSRRVRRPMRYDQDQVVLRLAAGAHTLLVKVLEEEGEWEFQARLTPAAGMGRSDLVFADGAPPAPAATEGRDEAAPEALAADPLHMLDSLLGRLFRTGDDKWALREALDASPEATGPNPQTASLKPQAFSEVAPLHVASMYFFKGVILHGRFDYDVYKESPHREALRQAVNAAPDLRVGRTLLLWHKAQAEFPVARMEPEKDYNPYLETLRELLALDAGNAAALSALALYYGQVRALPRAGEYIERMPKSADARPYLLAILDGWKDWDWKRLPHLTPYLSDSYYAPGVSLLFEELLKHGRSSDALAALRRLLVYDYTNGRLVERYVDAVIDSGDYRQAEEVIRTAARLQPLAAGLFRARLRLLEKDAAFEQAALLVRDRAALVPQDAGLYELEGRFLNLAGRKDQAAEALRTALAIEPNLASVKRYLETTATTEDYAREYQVDPAPLIRKHRDYANPEGHPALVLVDQMVSRIARDGLSSATVHRVIKLLTTQGVERYGSASVRYDRDEQTIKWLAARVHRPDGRVDEATVPHGGSVTLPSPRVGDVVELRYRLDEVRRSFFGDHEEEIFLFGDTVPMALSELIVIAPEDYTVSYHLANAPAGARTEPDVKKSGGAVVCRWRFQDTPAVKQEPDMPALTELAPTIYVSHFADWPAFGRWYWSLIREQHTASETLRSKVREITAGKEGTLEKIRALYHFVTNDIEYVAWEFGVHGFKPYDASSILERKFGDCKDKATLLKVMLAEIGVPAQQALLRADASYIRQDLTRPLFRHFNHAICYVPAGRDYPELWLDGTAQYYPFGSAPPPDSARQSCVVLEDAGGKLMRIPAPKPEEHLVDAETVVHFTAGGPEGLIAHVEAKSQARGQPEASIRHYFHNPGQRRERLEELFARRYAACTVNWENFPDLADMYAPCEFAYSVDLERFVRREAGRFAVPLFQGFPRPLSFRGLVGLEKRQTPLALDFMNPYRSRVRYRCPEGYRFAGYPRSEEAAAAGCRFSLRATTEGRDVVVEESIEITKERVAPAEYADFRRFMLTLDRAEAQELTLEEEK